MNIVRQSNQLHVDCSRQSKYGSIITTTKLNCIQTTTEKLQIGIHQLLVLTITSVLHKQPETWPNYLTIYLNYVATSGPSKASLATDLEHKSVSNTPPLKVKSSRKWQPANQHQKTNNGSECKQVLFKPVKTFSHRLPGGKTYSL